MDQQEFRRPNIFFPLLMMIVMMVILFFAQRRNSATPVTWAHLVQDVESGNAADVTIVQNPEVPTGSVRYTTGSGRYSAAVSDVREAQEYLNAKGKTFLVQDIEQENTFFTFFWPLLAVGVLVAVLCLFVTARMMGAANGGGQMSTFGRSRAQCLMPGDEGINFGYVAGLEEEKGELAEVVDFLKDPQKYITLGARIPKGILLVGPPGTGKTLLAKAIAGEAGVPFFTISGSDFVEMFVGVGASRVRDLFEEAKKRRPCIVFIDEIDAVARRRGSGLGGGHDEREQTLNQLLVEMDGFKPNEGIIVMAATNRVDILDPAIMRPGRFDRKVGVGRPDVKAREAILHVHARNKPLGDDVDLERVARTTAGFTGADLENLMNEAAIRAARGSKAFVRQEDIDAAFVRVGIGTEKHSRVISDEEKRITAYHETGHAILFHVLPHVGPVHTVSVIPTGTGAAGYTMPLPDRDEMFRSRSRLLEEITVSLGGRIAEELVLGESDITTGASQDIREATELARAMVTKYGMSRTVGMVNYAGEEDEVFIGRDMARTRAYSESVAAEIDGEVRAIIRECYDRGREVILANRGVLDACAALLMEKEKIGQDEFEALFA